MRMSPCRPRAECFTFVLSQQPGREGPVFLGSSMRRMRLREECGQASGARFGIGVESLPPVLSLGDTANSASVP